MRAGCSSLVSFPLLLGKLSNPNPALKALHSSSDQVFPTQGTAGRLHRPYKSAVTLERVNRHRAFIFLTAAGQIWLLQKSQGFLQTSDTTSCPSLSVFAVHYSIKSWKNLIEQILKKSQDIHLAHPAPFYIYWKHPVYLLFQYLWIQYILIILSIFSFSIFSFSKAPSYRYKNFCTHFIAVYMQSTFFFSSLEPQKLHFSSW